MNSVTSTFYQGYPVFQATRRTFTTKSVSLLQNNPVCLVRNLRKLEYHMVANVTPSVSDGVIKSIFPRLCHKEKSFNVKNSRISHKEYTLCCYFSSTKLCRNDQQRNNLSSTGTKCESSSRFSVQANNTKNLVLASNNVLCGISSLSGRIPQNVCCFQPSKFLHTRSTTAKADSEKNEEPLQTFKPIYRFKYIVLFKTVSRFKIYQTFFTLAFIQPLIKAQMSGEVSPEFTISVLSVGGLAVLMLYVMSIYIRRTVGMLSISEDCNQVKLSHLSFWGKKRDVFIPVNEVIPFTDTSESYRNVYQIIQLYNKPDKWYFFSNHGDLYDNVVMETIFGKFS